MIERAQYHSILDVERAIHAFCKDDFKNTLAVFDLDMTLVRPDDPLVSSWRYEPYASYVHEILKDFSGEQVDMIFNLSLSTGSLQPMEDATLEFFQRLKGTDAAVLALTATLTGPLGPFPRFETYRHQALEEMGFSFTPNLCASEDFTINLPPYRGNLPTFYHGIMFGNGLRSSTSKGGLLRAFLEHSVVKPQRIVFVDDLELHTEQVASAFDTSHMDLLAIHYNHGQNLAPTAPPMDQFQERWQKLYQEITK